MHTRDFLDQAVLLASYFDLVVTAGQRLPEKALQGFWIASRSRFDAWGIELRKCTDQLDATDYSVDRMWRRWTPLLEEVLVSEIVTRMWSYMLEAVDDQLGLREYSPIGQSAFRAHIDARRRVLNLILRGRQRELPAVWRLNRQRMSIERWTDLLLSQTLERSWLADYAFDVQRVQQFSGFDDAPNQRQSILRAASQAAFAKSSQVSTAHVDFHTRMHAAMLGCFGRELFLGDGPLLSVWQARMLAVTDETQGLLDRWLNGSQASDCGPESPGTLRRFE